MGQRQWFALKSSTYGDKANDLGQSNIVLTFAALFQERLGFIVWAFSSCVAKQHAPWITQ